MRTLSRFVVPLVLFCLVLSSPVLSNTDDPPPQSENRWALPICGILVASAVPLVMLAAGVFDGARPAQDWAGQQQVFGTPPRFQDEWIPPAAFQREPPIAIGPGAPPVAVQSPPIFEILLENSRDIYDIKVTIGKPGFTGVVIAQSDNEGLVRLTKEAILDGRRAAAGQGVPYGSQVLNIVAVRKENQFGPTTAAYLSFDQLRDARVHQWVPSIFSRLGLRVTFSFAQK